MTGRTHDLAAFTALGLVVIFLPMQHNITLGTGIAALISNMIGGIAPDIDQPTAPFWRNLPIGRVAAKIFSPLVGGHRFISHSIIGVGLFGLGWHYFLQFLQPSIPTIDINVVWWAFMIGFVSHLVMDTLTREGVPWLLPIPIKIGIPPLKAFRVTTNGFSERFMIFPGLLLFNIYLYYANYATILDLIKHHVK